MDKDKIIGVIIGFLCGAGIATGLFFVGKSKWPAESKEGSCIVTPNNPAVSWKCIGRSNEGNTFKISSANVTFEDGTVRNCNGFWLTDTCGGLFGASKPTAVLAGEARPCHWFEEAAPVKDATQDAGACAEPGQVQANINGAILWWIIAAILWTCCCVAPLIANAKGADSEGHEEDEEDEEDEAAMLA